LGWGEENKFSYLYSPHPSVYVGIPCPASSSGCAVPFDYPVSGSPSREKEQALVQIPMVNKVKVSTIFAEAKQGIFDSAICGFIRASKIRPPEIVKKL
jgi:hypothetical protein